MNGSTGNECERARLLVDRRLDEGIEALTPDQAADLDAHLNGCPPCLLRQAQMREIVAAAKAAPQFDVSEALTQRILTSVEPEGSGRMSVVQVAGMLALLGAGAGVFVSDSIESLYGIGSWCVAVAAMVVIKAVIGGAQPRKQASR